MAPPIPPQSVYTWVQKMNNSAALCLQIRQYERAIKTLAKALQLSRSYIEQLNNNNSNGDDQSQTPCCGCHLCSFDGCIHYSEDHIRNCNIHRSLRTMDSRGSISDNKREETIRKRFLQRRQERRNIHGIDSSHDSHKNNAFLYHRLIQVPDISDHNCHEIQSKQIVTLSVICIFNLAVVCHIRAMDAKKNNGASKAISTDLRKALQLYEVAYKALDKQHDSSEFTARTSVQFKLILCNNLSHVHNLCGNRSQYERYLREVLSVTMSLVDSKRPWNTTSNNSLGNAQGNEQDCAQGDCNKVIDLEGFLDNAAPLLTENVCANAA